MKTGRRIRCLMNTIAGRVEATEMNCGALADDEVRGGQAAAVATFGWVRGLGG